MKKQVISFIVLILMNLIFAPQTLVAQENLENSNAEIFGFVSDIHTGQRLAEVTISLVDQTGQVIKTVDTHTDGSYRLYEIIPGTYQVRVEFGGYISESRDVTLGEGDARYTYFYIYPITDTASVYGFISDIHTGERLKGATVSIIDQTGQVIKTVDTHTDGSYRLYEIIPGTYQVRVDFEGYVTATRDVTLAEGDARYTYFYIYPITDTASVYGFISDIHTGKRLTGVTISLIDQTGQVIKTVDTHTDGSYRLYEIIPGTYQVRVEFGGYISESRDVTLGEGDARYTYFYIYPITDTAAVYGFVSDIHTGKRLTGATISLVDQEGQVVKTVDTHTDGSYRLYEIVPGTYQVKVEFAGYETTTRDVTLGEGDARYTYFYIYPITDADEDGVPDEEDSCLGTEKGAVVNVDGCSIVQICPAGNDYKNHGKYVSCLSKTSETFIEEGLITEDEKDGIVSFAAKSNVGKK